MRGALILLGVLVMAAAGEPAGDLALFRDKVEPILREHCYGCHDAAAEAKKKLKGGLRMDTWAGLAKGGKDRGPAVVPGNPAKSSLITSITIKDEDEQMPPPAKPRVPAAALAVLEAWITAGAPHPDRSAGAATAVTPPVPPGPPAPPPTTIEQITTDVGLKHPAVVHFPVACLVLALLAELLSLCRCWKTSWENTVRLALAVGLAGAAASVVSGLILAGDAPTALQLRHRNLAFFATGGATLSAILLWVSARRPAWRWAFRLALLVSVVLVCWAGHVGGEKMWEGRG